MNGTWSFVDADGAFTGRTFSGPERDLAANIPDGCTAVEGLLRLPPAPKRTGDRRRARIDELERAQARPMRELQLDPANVEAKRRLVEIEREIARLRGEHLAV